MTDTGDSTLTPHPLSELDFSVSTMGMAQGLPQNSINDILQASDGYIWVATFGGLVRFDGNRFTTFNRSTHLNFQFDRILKMHEGADGSIWMMSENAQTVLVRFYEGAFYSYLIKPNQMSESPIFMVNDNNGTLWLSAFQTIYRFNGERFVEAETKELSEDDIIEALSGQGAFIAAGRTLFKVRDDSVALKLYNFKDLVSDHITDVAVNPRDSNVLFLSTFNDGIIRWEPGTVPSETIVIINANKPNPIFRFQKDKKGNLFGRHFGGMTVWDGSEFVPFYPFDEEKNGSVDVQITNVLEDAEGNYWIGTFSKGLYKLRPSVIKMIDAADGLKNERILSLTELSDGTVIFGTNCGGYYEWNQEKLSYSSFNQHGDIGCGWVVFEDSYGGIWFGGASVFRAENREVNPRMILPESWLRGAGIFAISEDKTGVIWISTGEGLGKYNPQTGELNQFTTDDGLYFNDARALLPDEKGFMWVGTKAGLNIIRDDSVEKIRLIEQTENGQIPQQPYIRAFHKDASGALWIGTYGDGIFRLKDGKADQITKKDGLFDDIVSHLIPDNRGYMWMGSNRGLARVLISDLNRFVEGDISRVNAFSYTTRDGMNSSETNGGFQPNHAQTRDGRIYLPTVAGVAVVSTADVTENKVPPPVYIESVATIDSTLNTAADITISHNTPYLEINYTAINFTEPGKVAFKYKLIGLDDDWITVGNARKAIYSKVPAGEYRFQVVARNEHGIWNNSGASIGISVTPPYWQTWWFYTLSGIFLLGLTGTALYRREQKFQMETDRQKRFAEQLIESQEHERRRIANELHDSLGQQILVIKNRAELARMQVNDHDHLIEQLDEIRGSAIQSIENVRTISHGLRPVHLEKFGLTESLQNLCDDVMQTSSIDWSYQIDRIDDIFEEKKDINFYRIIQEGITNILRHSEASEASVFVRRTDERVTAKLWDNGKGLQVNAQLDSHGLGFLGMNERAGTLGGNLDVQSEPGAGTTITLTIPLNHHDNTG